MKACILVGIWAFAFLLFSNTVAGQEAPEARKENNLKTLIDECGTLCLGGLIAICLAVGLCVPFTLWCILCKCRPNRQGSYKVTEEGLSLVAEKAAKRLANCASNLAPPENMPRSGRYIGACTDIYRTKRVDYVLKFHDNGLVSGNTENDEHSFEIQGHYNQETGKYHWGETVPDAYYKNFDHPEVYTEALINGEAVHQEVDASIVDGANRMLEAHYVDTTNSTGFMTLTWTEPLPTVVEVEHDDDIEHRRLV